MDLDRYLGRINYSGSRHANSATLRALHISHLQTVPFENLDVYLGRPISLNGDDLFDKIVVRRRGGFCYELNGLFAMLLEGLGYVVTRLSARVVRENGTLGPEFDHLTLLVQCPGNPTTYWLADVGFGDSFTEPLQLANPDLQPQGLRAYRLDQTGNVVMLWQRNYDGLWERQYRFTLQARALGDFAAMCRYHQMSPASPFTQNRICTLATPNGRISLDNDRLISTKHGVRQERVAGDEETYCRLLKVHFGVVP